ncbi:MAG: sulfite exporter TauE/SafE family protein [Betaproteobacteria bacterium]|nr:sulfite exporter TauE/SafE family protein [Betaproteobacteria bacterium]
MRGYFRDRGAGIPAGGKWRRQERRFDARCLRQIAHFRVRRCITWLSTVLLSVQCRRKCSRLQCWENHQLCHRGRAGRDVGWRTRRRWPRLGDQRNAACADDVIPVCKPDDCFHRPLSDGGSTIACTVGESRGHLWRHVSPYAKKLLPLRSLTHATLFGMLWGWIPCGLVYAMLLTAMSAGSTARGAMTMAAFGLGTLPVMVATGWSAGRLRGWTRKPRVRMAAGIAVVAMGVFGIARLGTLAQLQAFGAFCMTLIPPAAP